MAAIEDEPEGWQRQPEQKDKLAYVVKRKPIDDANKTLNHTASVNYITFRLMIFGPT